MDRWPVDQGISVFTIKAVSQATGISIETLRAWERRYGVVEPRREPNGRRSYEAADVIRLRRLREATERGHPISKLARIADDALAGLLAEPSPHGGEAMASSSFAERILDAAERYRPGDCEQALSMALALLPLREVISHVLSPVLVEVGNRWHAGQFNVAQERLVSTMIRRQIGNVLDTYNRNATGPPLVLATLPGEPHEIGILMGALLAAARGWRCHYLGPELPPGDLAVFADRVGASVVALSVVLRSSGGAALAQLKELAQRLPRATEIWIGGAAAGQLDLAALGERVLWLADYDAFAARLDLRATPAG